MLPTLHGDTLKEPSGLSTPESDISRASRTSPQLEIQDLGALPFSESFTGLFDLDYSVNRSSIYSNNIVASDDGCLDLKRILQQQFTNFKDFDPEWEHDEIEEIVVMKRKTKLPRISEEASRGNCNILALMTAATHPSQCTGHMFISNFEILHSLRSPSTSNSRAYTLDIGRHRQTSKLYALKSVPFVAESDRKDARLEQHILETLTALRCPSLPQLHESFEHMGRFYFIAEMYPGNDLHTRIRSGGKLSVERSRTYASELCNAIVALHGAGIVHGDLRPEHVLFDHDDHVVLTNFSCATFVGSSRLCLAPPNEYQAPEALLGWALHYSVDCWAFGVLLHVMLFGKHPFALSSRWQDLSEIRKSVVNGPTSLGAADGDQVDSSSAIILLKKCLERNPAMRCTIHEIRHDAFFSVEGNEPLVATLDALVNHRSIPTRESMSSISVYSERETTPAAITLEFPLPPISTGKGDTTTITDAILDLAPGKSSPTTAENERIGFGESGTRTTLAPDNSEEERRAVRERLWETISLDTESASEMTEQHSVTTERPRTWSGLRKTRSLVFSTPWNFLTALVNRSRTTVSISNSTKHKQNKLRKLPPVALPEGVEQIGDGIAYRRRSVAHVNPGIARSKASICATGPATRITARGCQPSFSGGPPTTLGLGVTLNRGLSLGAGLGLGLGLGRRITRKQHQRAQKPSINETETRTTGSNDDAAWAHLGEDLVPGIVNITLPAGLFVVPEAEAAGVESPLSDVTTAVGTPDTVVFEEKHVTAEVEEVRRGGSATLRLVGCVV